MTIYGSDAVIGSIRVPVIGGTTGGTPFSVPKGAYAVTFICPSTAATFSIQTLSTYDDQTTDAWSTISAATGVTLVPLTAIAMSAVAVTYNIAQIGGGTLRLLASTDLSGAAITIKVVFHMLP